MTIMLQRFLQAQDKVYPEVVRELRAGKKQGHWMWFVFPQIHGLGKSPTAVFYAIQSIEEARDYLQHPILGQRYLECLKLLLEIHGKSAEQIFGYPDVLKLHSSLTLFQLVSENHLFKQLLDKYFAGEPDKKTIEFIYPATP